MLSPLKEPRLCRCLRHRTRICAHTNGRRAIIKEVDTSAHAASATTTVTDSSSSSRNGKGNGNSGRSSGLERYTLHATVPLRELVGYASSLRALTGGEASFAMHLAGYARMDAFTAKQVLKDGY
jgi:translation elongation factor EF-G